MIVPIAGMLAGSALAWVAAVALFGSAVGRDVALGMAAPIVAVVATWVMVVRAHRRNPADVTGVMVQGFVGKMVFFGAYVVVVWTQAVPDPVSFVVSFTGSFLTLYLVEAVLLGRLFRAGSRVEVSPDTLGE